MFRLQNVPKCKYADYNFPTGDVFNIACFGIQNPKAQINSINNFIKQRKDVNPRWNGMNVRIVYW